MGLINEIAFDFPSYALLTQPENINENDFCNETSLPERCKDKPVCSCVHRLKAKLNSIFELIILDVIPDLLVSHPFHIHGYRVLVTGMGMYDEKPITHEHVQEMVKNNRLPKIEGNLQPYKDTVSIPSKGFTTFRFKADNTGYWLMHCYYGENILKSSCKSKE